MKMPDEVNKYLLEQIGSRDTYIAKLEREIALHEESAYANYSWNMACAKIERNAVVAVWWQLGMLGIGAPVLVYLGSQSYAAAAATFLVTFAATMALYCYDYPKGVL